MQLPTFQTLYRQMVYSTHLAILYEQHKRALKCLVLFTLPMEVNTYNHIIKRKAALGILRYKTEPVVHLTVPPQTAIRTDNLIYIATCNSLTCNIIIAYESESYLVCQQHTYVNIIHHPRPSITLSILSSSKATSRSIPRTSSSVSVSKSSMRGVITSPAISNAPGLIRRLPSSL